MQSYLLGVIFIILGVLLVIRNPQVRPELQRGKVRGIGGPVLLILGILMLFGVLPGIG